MERELLINNKPLVDELWSGIGGHFDSLGQIVNEFVDNSISNFKGNVTMTRSIIISLRELVPNGAVKVIIEDSGSGIKELDTAFTLGSQRSAETPLNEHGFGLKHALATANPENDSWCIYTRTKEDLENGVFKKISAPYMIEEFKGKICDSEPWPGKLNGTGTIVEFVCSREMYNTLTRGIKGGMVAFDSVADVLCEDIGFVYAGIIENDSVSITMEICNFDGEQITRAVGALKPDWEDYFAPGSGREEKDLGGGNVCIEYQFGKIHEKQSREKFNNSTARKYYRKNMSSSGVEIRINGRVLCNNLFKEIWGIEKHNSYNYLLILINLKSDDKNALPKTKTSKNGFREGDEKLENLYSWIRSNLSSPVKDVSLSEHEIDLFEELKERMLSFNPDPNKIIETEKYVFVNTGNKKDKVRVDLYTKTMNQITVYEGKKEITTSKDVYQLRMYWDGLVYDGIKPDKGILVANEHPDSVKNLISIVNTMKDSNGNNYVFECKTWNELGLPVVR